MDINTLTSFFGWTVVISFSLLLLITIASSLMPDLSYRLQTKFFPISRDDYTLTIYRFLALFKVLTIVLFFVPYVALKIMA